MKEKDWCDTCKEPWASEQCNTCQYGYGKENNYKPQTKADKIRAMSDEELATFFGTLPCCPPGSAEELCYPENTCGADTKMMVKCWGTWLKAPVEVEE